MSQNLINISKKILVFYCFSVLVALSFFLKISFGYYYAVLGIFFLLIHVVEIFIFNKVLIKYSNNLNRDRLLMLPFGMLVPTELKLKNKLK